MTPSQLIAPHLPFLRRYARALTGSQSSGDAWVRTCLEALLGDPSRLATDLPPRVALYQAFHAIWNAAAVDEAAVEVSGTEEDKSAQARLRRLIPERRQALLLTALEGFTSDEAAIIMGSTAQLVKEMVDMSMDDISHDLATTVLIIEDEPVTAIDLSEIVQELGHRVTQVSDTRASAVAAFKENQAGLVLADVRLADDSSGIDAVNEILEMARVPVIFITAYPERLLTGERPEPTFLITKPFLPDSIKAAVSQALFFYPPDKAATWAGRGIYG